LNRLQFHDDQKEKKERSKKELKQRSKNETKWQKEQPLQLAGVGSGRNASEALRTGSLPERTNPENFCFARTNPERTAEKTPNSRTNPNEPILLLKHP